MAGSYRTLELMLTEERYSYARLSAEHLRWERYIMQLRARIYALEAEVAKVRREADAWQRFAASRDNSWGGRSLEA